MHYDVKYDTDNDERKACAHALEFMGCIRYRIIVDQIKGNVDENTIRFLAMMSGVQGFPITAMINRYKRKETIH